MMTVAGIGRRLELGRFGTARPFDLLCRGIAGTSSKEASGGSSRQGLQQFAPIPKHLWRSFLPSFVLHAITVSFTVTTYAR
jgi:hypothetical protein